MNAIIDKVMQDINSRPEWQEEVRRGKMFGVLRYKDAEGNEGWLKAFSGQILGRSDWDGYVPAIFDYLQPDGYFKRHEAVISDINERVRNMQEALPKGKRTAELEALKAERKERSNILQRWLFSQFVIAGHDGASASVLDVFAEYAKENGLKQLLPPGGTGECCAPKLLHYANSHGLQPLELAEFWYGESPRGEVRHHGMLYEPCQAKCQPILWFMMPKEGMKVLGTRAVSQKRVTPQLTADDIIYEDDWLIAINKPAGLLSVPGKRQMPNAQDQLKALRPDVYGMVHRLDMDTSGVLLAAKSVEAYEAMQRLFAAHEEVQKEYIAKVQGAEGMSGKSGRITLPLSPDFLNRPRQCVDYEHGKEAITDYRFITDDTVLLYPKTGRTHQLRMHCAHQDGLAMPIVGDPLYGNVVAERMYLHAQRISFTHPFTAKRTEIFHN